MIATNYFSRVSSGGRELSPERSAFLLRLKEETRKQRSMKEKIAAAAAEARKLTRIRPGC